MANLAAISGGCNDIFLISGNNPRTLKIEDIDPDNMWGALQTLLNEGKYEQAEMERLSRISEQTPPPTIITASQKTTDNGNYYLYGIYSVIVGVITFVTLYYILIFRKRE